MAYAERHEEIADELCLSAARVSAWLKLNSLERKRKAEEEDSSETEQPVAKKRKLEHVHSGDSNSSSLLASEETKGGTAHQLAVNTSASNLTPREALRSLPLPLRDTYRV